MRNSQKYACCEVSIFLISLKQKQNLIPIFSQTSFTKDYCDLITFIIYEKNQHTTYVDGARNKKTNFKNFLNSDFS